MSISGFDYKEIAQNFKEQAAKIIPNDVSKENANYIKNIIANYSLLAGEAINNDKTNNWNSKNAIFVVQIIAEWSFHKSLDLIRSEIPDKYWDGILQRIAFTVYEISKQALIREISKEEILAAIEYHVNKSYKESLDKLIKENSITENVYNNALKLSNIDEMVKNFKCKESTQKQMKEDCVNIEQDTNEQKSFLKKDFFYICLAIGTLFFTVNLISSLIINILDNLKFPIQPWIIVSLVMLAVAYFLSILVNRDVQNQLEQLEDIKQNMQDLVDPNKMYERLGVDVLKIHIGVNLLPIADPDQEGKLLANVAALRQKLTDKLGYIIPNIRIQDNSELLPNEYKILVREKEVARGFVYANRVMVKANILEEFGFKAEDNTIVAVDKSNKKVYWIEKDIIPKEIEYLTPELTIIEHLNAICIEQIDKIMSVTDVEKLVTLVTSQSETLSNQIFYYITIFDLKNILVKLIKENISIKDIMLIFEKIAEHSRYDCDVDYITKKIKEELKY